MFSRVNLPMKKNGKMFWVFFRIYSWIHFRIKLNLIQKFLKHLRKHFSKTFLKTLQKNVYHKKIWKISKAFFKFTNNKILEFDLKFEKEIFKAFIDISWVHLVFKTHENILEFDTKFEKEIFKIKIWKRNIQNKNLEKKFSKLKFGKTFSQIFFKLTHENIRIRK